MKKLSIYISTFLLTCQFGIEAMDVNLNKGRKRGGDDPLEDQTAVRLSSEYQDDALVPMDLNDIDEPWGDPTFQMGFVSYAQTDNDSLEGETKKRKQTLLIALKDLMCEARSNPTLLGPFAIEDLINQHFQELRDEERADLIEASLVYLLSEATSPTDPLLNCKLVTIIMNESFQANPLILDFAKRVSAFWDKLPEIDRERRNAVAVFFLTDDTNLIELAHTELNSDYFLRNSTIWPIEAALGALLEKNRKDIARAFIERVMALPENQGKDFRNTHIIEHAERIDPYLSALLEEFSALEIKDKKADGG